MTLFPWVAGLTRFVLHMPTSRSTVSAASPNHAGSAASPDGFQKSFSGLWDAVIEKFPIIHIRSGILLVLICPSARLRLTRSVGLQNKLAVSAKSYSVARRLNFPSG